MPAAIAAAAVLAMAMRVKQALDCWETLNRGMDGVLKMSSGVKSSGNAIISLLAFARQPAEGLKPGLECSDQVLHCFFEQLQSEDLGVQQLKTLFLDQTGSEDSFSLQDSESIGEVLLALQLVCEHQDILQCLQNIEHGKPSASIVGLVAGALIGVSDLEKMADLPCIHSHQAAQLRAITSILANCYEVSIFICTVLFTI